MSEAQTQQWIIILTVITVGSTVSGMIIQSKSIQLKKKEQHKQEETEVREKKKKTTAATNTHRAIVGAFFAMAGCSIIANFSPEAGVGLAVLVAGGAFFTYGLPTISDYYKEGLKKK